MDLYRKVRLACAEGMSQREAARHFGISRDSVRKILAFSIPPGYRRSAPIGYSRRNFMVPVPNFPTWDAFNDWLEEQCRKRQADMLRGHKETIGERLQRDLEAMAPLRATQFEACDQASGRVSSLALVRYKTNDYSVPVAFGHRDVWIRAYVDRVVIGCGGEVIARHLRSYDREDMICDPIHYLPLIEKTINVFRQAGQLVGWELPKAFSTLQELMEARLLKAARREYVQVLLLLESFDMEEVHAAAKTALQINTGCLEHDLRHLRPLHPTNERVQAQLVIEKLSVLPL